MYSDYVANVVFSFIVAIYLSATMPSEAADHNTGFDLFRVSVTNVSNIC